MSKRLWIPLLMVLSSCGPLYTPGQVAREASKGALSLAPAASSEDSWEVEPGIRLFHFSRGKGRTVLFVPGGPGLPPAEPWPSLEPLTDRFRWVYYDQRGSGRSTRPIDTFSSPDFGKNLAQLESSLGMAAQLADIERIRRMLGEEKLILFGHSYGGFLALLYAREFPDHVEKLILAAPAQMLSLPPPAGGGLYGAVESRLAPSSLPGYSQWLKEFFDFGTVFQKSEARLVALNNAFVPYWSEAASSLGPTWGNSEAFHPELTGGWISVSLAFSLGSSYDLRSELERVKVPVLLVAGDRDLAASAGSLADYARLLPQAQTVVLPGGGHFLSQAPGTLAQAVGAFLDS